MYRFRDMTEEQLEAMVVKHSQNPQAYTIEGAKSAQAELIRRIQERE